MRIRPRSGAMKTDNPQQRNLRRKATKPSEAKPSRESVEPVSGTPAGSI